jgi:hypothetical protein
MSSANGKAPPDALEELDEVIRELEGSAWDEISEVTENHIHIHAPLAADASGRHAAMEVTRPDHARPRQDSLAEKALDVVPGVLDRVEPRQRGWVAVAIVVTLGLVAIAWLRWG